jgi:hypothetical protein
VDAASFSSCEASLPTNIQNAVRFQAAVGQGLQGFSASFDLTKSPGAGLGDTAFLLTFRVKRDGVLKFFAVITFMSGDIYSSFSTASDYAFS